MSSLFFHIYLLVCNVYVLGINSTNDNHFAPMAEQAINVIYSLSEHPETVAENIIRKVITLLIVKDGQSPLPSDNTQDAQTQGIITVLI